MELKLPLKIDSYLLSIGSKDYTFDISDANGYVLVTTQYKEIADIIKKTLEKEFESEKHLNKDETLKEFMDKQGISTIGIFGV